ncbi:MULTISPECIES: sensor histidine kinase [Nocardia]|uniref:sensor histidine kinase n=1 Tax=Nocardia TaxID=1817 RepID=UPI0018E5A7F8|nr:MULTISPECIES: nitrate- and nitrite sensing domain-containing protein [Nocardia]
MLAIALVPCVALLGTGTIIILVLTKDARATNRWSVYLDEQVDPLATFVTAVQEERLQSLFAMNADPRAASGLATHRAKTDAALAALGRMGVEMLRLNPQAVARSTPAFVELAARTPVVRHSVDMGQADIAAVDDFYRALAGTVGPGLEDLARYTPDPLTATEEMTAGNLVETAELHSRAAAIAAAVTESGSPLGFDERRTVTELVGAYRHQLDALGARLTDDGRQRLARLTGSAEWRTATTAEDALAERGVLPVPHAEFLAAERAIDVELVGLFRDHALYANTLATAAADRSLERVIWAGIGVAATAISAFVLALLLANRLVARLRSLRSRTLELANETLPSIIERLHDGQAVDVAAETTILDHGLDEIGQVAAAFGTAQRTAMTAAASEARTREGFNKVFLDIAHRSQVVVRRQLDVLDIAESKQDDPEHLELLFQLDHLATRARRNAENLLILGGGQPGRRWRDPVALEQIVRSAVSETDDLTRVSAIRLPTTHVLGNAVADLIHLLAELIDNAALFSPPQSLVSIHGNLVGRGVVIEVEDQGLGIRFDERERLNDLLREPQDFQELALAGQRHLGLFVVSRLAKRHALTVNLQESAYGGVKAIVLIPTALLEIGDGDADPVPAVSTRARRALDQPTRNRTEQVPRLSALISPQVPPWPDNRSHEDRSPDGLAREHQRTSSGDEPGIAPADVTARTGPHRRAPLPKRRKQSHLAPELRVDEEPPEIVWQSPDQRRPATEVRRSMASFQKGTRQARTSTTNPNREAGNGPAT